MCGAFLFGSMWGFWWIFPLLALAMCVLMMFRFARSGHGCMGMGGHRANSDTIAPNARNADRTSGRA